MTYHGCLCAFTLQKTVFTKIEEMRVIEQRSRIHEKLVAERKMKVAQVFVVMIE